MTTSKPSSTDKKAAAKSPTPTPKKLETEFPLSEKDEVKKAEHAVAKNIKKGS